MQRLTTSGGIGEWRVRNTRAIHGQVRKSGQETARKFCSLETRAYLEGLKRKGEHFGSSGRIHPDKRNNVPYYLLLAHVVHYDRPGESDRQRIPFLDNPYNELSKLGPDNRIEAQKIQV